MSTACRLSSASPKRRARRPKPPPSVSPPTPVCDTVPERRDEAERHRFVVEFAEQAAALDVGASRRGIDAHAAEARQVDLHAPVAGGLAAGAVAAALDREQQLALAREVHGVAHVRDAGRLHDERGPACRSSVQHAARLVVAGIAREQQRARAGSP